MADTGQPSGIKDYSERPDSIIQIGVVIGDPGRQAAIPRATVTMTKQKQRLPFRTFPVGGNLLPAASS